MTREPDQYAEVSMYGFTTQEFFSLLDIPYEEKPGTSATVIFRRGEVFLNVREAVQ